MCSPFKTEPGANLLKRILEIRMAQIIKNDICPFLLKIFLPNSIPIIIIPKKDIQNKGFPICDIQSVKKGWAFSATVNAILSVPNGCSNIDNTPNII